jgi:hypothetical protein
MRNDLDHRGDDGRPATYEIRIAGRLDPRWEEWFDGLKLTNDNGETLITGPILDQAALYGVLRRVRDLGMPLVSVARIDRGRTRTVTPRRKE